MNAADFVPDTTSLPMLVRAAADCQGCELFEHATQTVFGQGLKRARAVLVGEQPGDMEDRQGVPFVGPAGRVLDRALNDAGIERRDVYLTNAVKHFRWTPAPRGKRRIHATPEARHITACRPWLTAELTAIRPDVVVALGAVAAKALFGSSFRLTQHRGERLDWPPPTGAYAEDNTPIKTAFATVHPSSILRADPDDRDDAYDQFVHDLQVAARNL
ncbi:MAG TPA: UdgX family uracil-DNA binding protein [Mycobacterium sp.]|nr:UdgX family uracil-DNA binding protein [Mycobacterium sp.]